MVNWNSSVIATKVSEFLQDSTPQRGAQEVLRKELEKLAHTRIPRNTLSDHLRKLKSRPSKKSSCGLHVSPQSVTPPSKTHKQLTKFNHTFLSVEGRSYIFNRKRNNGATYYRCEQCKTICDRTKEKGLTGRAIVDEFGFRESRGHHPECKIATPAQEKALQIDREQRNKVASGELQPQPAYNQGFFRCVAENRETAKAFPAQHEIIGSYMRVRRQQAERIEDAFDLPANYKETYPVGEEVPRRWHLDGSEEHGYHIFATDENLKVLAKAKYVVADGTFKKAPKNFSQLVTIHGWIEYEQGFEWHPLVSIIMTDKEKTSYVAAFTSIKNFWTTNNIEPVVERVHSDYEDALRDGLSVLFGKDKLYGCSFHYVYNLQKYAIQHCGLFEHYMSKEFRWRPIRIWLRACMALLYLPYDDAMLLFKNVLCKPPLNDKDPDWPTIGLWRFAVYMYREWLSKKTANNTFYDQNKTRNTNIAESYNSILGRDSELPLNGQLSLFLQKLRQYHCKTEIRMEQLLEGARPRVESKKYKKLNARLKRYERDFEAERHQKEGVELYTFLYAFIRRVSYLVHEIKNKSLHTRKKKTAKKGDLDSTEWDKYNPEEKVELDIISFDEQNFKEVLKKEAELENEPELEDVVLLEDVVPHEDVVPDKTKEKNIAAKRNSKVKSGSSTKHPGKNNVVSDRAPPPAYHPPTFPWIAEACAKLQIPREEAQNSLLYQIDPTVRAGRPRTRLEAVGDGNCGFRSLSLLLTNSEKHHQTIRKALNDYIINNEEEDYGAYYDGNFFEDAQYQNERMDGRQLGAVGQRWWMNSGHFAVITDVLQCKLLVYKTNDDQYTAYCYPKVRVLRERASESRRKRQDERRMLPDEQRKRQVKQKKHEDLEKKRQDKQDELIDDTFPVLILEHVNNNHFNAVLEVEELPNE